MYGAIIYMKDKMVTNYSYTGHLPSDWAEVKKLVLIMCFM